jgi:hypothetical protein
VILNCSQRQNIFTHIHHSHYRQQWLDLAPKQRPGSCYFFCNIESLGVCERYASMGPNLYVTLCYYGLRCWVRIISNRCPCDLQNVHKIWLVSRWPVWRNVLSIFVPTHVTGKTVHPLAAMFNTFLHCWTILVVYWLQEQNIFQFTLLYLSIYIKM